MCSLETFPGKKRRQFILLAGTDKNGQLLRCLKIMTEIFRIKKHKWKSIPYFYKTQVLKNFTASKFISVLPVPDAEERAGIRHAISKGNT